MFTSIPFHSAIEALGALAAILMAVLLSARPGDGEEPCPAPISAGLLAMGVLDAFHGAVLPGSPFVFFHSAAMVAGGLGFGLSWLPLRRGKPWPWLFASGLALAVGLFGVALPSRVPAMVEEGAFTVTARATNAVGGLLFLAGAVRIASRASRPLGRRAQLLLLVALLNGAAGVSFDLTSLWSPGWWAWHGLRVTAALLLLSFLIRGQQRTWAQLRSLNAGLERRVAERTLQLEAANKELEAFAYSVSHDLRSPLRHIDGFVGMLTRHAGGSLDPEGKRYLSVISDSARRMAALIDDLLSFSRFGRVELKRGQVDLSQLVESVRADLSGEAEGRQIHWEVERLPVIEGDPAMLKQALANLLGNAIKYTRPVEQARIEVGSRREGAELVVFVKDNGVGFEMQYAGKLFQVFQRLHPAQQFEGTGIGLANVGRIIRRHGGRVWAEGAPGQGATFSFALPLHEAR